MATIASTAAVGKVYNHLVSQFRDLCGDQGTYGIFNPLQPPTDDDKSEWQQYIPIPATIECTLKGRIESLDNPFLHGIHPSFGTTPHNVKILQIG